MKCVICKHGSTDIGMVSVTLTREKRLSFSRMFPHKFAPTEVNITLNPTSLKKLMERASTAVDSGTEVEIVRYAA